MEEDLVLNESQKIELVESMLILLLRRDISVTRRIYCWCFGEPDIDNNYVIDESKHTVRLAHPDPPLHPGSLRGHVPHL
jgi:hypothetical protein